MRKALRVLGDEHFQEIQGKQSNKERCLNPGPKRKMNVLCMFAGPRGKELLGQLGSQEERL